MKRATLYIYTTYQCNLACKYCFLRAAGMLGKNEFVSLQDVIKASNSIAKYPNKKIVLYGGEPTLHPKITEIIRILRAKYRSAAINIVTNGTKINENLAEVFRENNVQVTLSWDYNNKYRAPQGDLSATLEKTYSLLKRAGILPTISATLFEQTDLIRAVNYFKNLGFRHIGFNFATVEGAKSFTDDAITYIIETYMQTGFKTEPIIGRVLLPLLKGDGKRNNGRRYCSAQTGDMFTLLPDGTLINGCHVAAATGKWQLTSWSVPEKCNTCPLKNICGGGCEYNRRFYPQLFDITCDIYIMAYYLAEELLGKSNRLKAG